MVRVSKDAPRELICGSDYLYTEIFSEVIAVAKGVANIKMEIHGTTKFTYIPTKYLIKVDAEAKEANVKIGDKVVVHYPSGDRIGRIKEVMLDGTYDIDFGGGCTGHNITR